MQHQPESFSICVSKLTCFWLHSRSLFNMTEESRQQKDPLADLIGQKINIHANNFQVKQIKCLDLFLVDVQMTVYPDVRRFLLQTVDTW